MNGCHRAARRIGAAMLVAGLAGLSACASAPRSVSQSLEVVAVTPMGATVPDARCQVRQGAAEWTVVPPARTTVMTSRDELLVRCEAAAGAARGEARSTAQVRGGRGMRALAGAGIGGVVGLAVGAADDSGNKGGMCCGGLGKAVGAVLGVGLGAAAGALSADPVFEYPARIRVVLEAVVPPASADTRP